MSSSEVFIRRSSGVVGQTHELESRTQEKDQGLKTNSNTYRYNKTETWCVGEMTLEWGVNLHTQETKIWMTHLARGEEGQSLNICEEENYLEKSF